jgi:hypothetical protein
MGRTVFSARAAVHRALARIPKENADQAREAQLARLQALRLLLWNHAGADTIRAAEALIKLEARETRLLGLDMPQKLGDHRCPGWFRRPRSVRRKFRCGAKSTVGALDRAVCQRHLSADGVEVDKVGGWWHFRPS